MMDLKRRDIRTVDNAFDMHGGHVLDFSDRTFAEAATPRAVLKLVRKRQAIGHRARGDLEPPAVSAESSDQAARGHVDGAPASSRGELGQRAQRVDAMTAGRGQQCPLPLSGPVPFSPIRPILKTTPVWGRHSPAGGSFAPVQLAGFRWNRWQTSAGCAIQRQTGTPRQNYAGNNT